VVPRSSRISIHATGASEFKIKLTSPPVDGAANIQLVEVLSDALKLPKRNVEIVSGQKGRRKVLQITGLDAKTIRERLDACSQS
jgi:uncharacterized protein